METKTIKIVCFAGLRKYFGGEINITLEAKAKYENVIEELSRIKPEAEEVLKSCRIAVKETFVSLDNKLHDTDTLFLIPPSSGG